MIRVERLVVPAAKSCCSIRSVRFPARAHSRAMATPLIPPPMITTWKRSLSNEGRVAIGEIMFEIRCYALGTSDKCATPSFSLLHSMLSGKVTLVQRNFHGYSKPQLQIDENTRTVVSGHSLVVSGWKK